MKKVLLIALSVIATCLVSCTSPQSSIEDLRGMVNELGVHSATYSEAEWQDAMGKYDGIVQSITENYSEYSTKQQKEILYLQNLCHGYFQKAAVSEMSDYLTRHKNTMESLKNATNEKK